VLLNTYSAHVCTGGVRVSQGQEMHGVAGTRRSKERTLILSYKLIRRISVRACVLSYKLMRRACALPYELIRQYKGSSGRADLYLLAATAGTRSRSRFRFGLSKYVSRILSRTGPSIHPPLGPGHMPRHGQPAPVLPQRSQALLPLSSASHSTVPRPSPRGITGQPTHRARRR